MLLCTARLNFQFIPCIGSVIRVDEYGNPVTFEARNLNENQIYEFWVSASTSIGEGEPTTVVAQTTNTRGDLPYYSRFRSFY